MGTKDPEILDTDDFPELADTTPPASAERRRVLPLDDVGRLAGETGRLVWAVRERLIAQCMSDAGFAYREEAFPEGTNVDSMRRLYPDDEAVRINGYLALVPTEEPPAPLVQSGSSELEGGEFAAALVGPDGDSGCSETARIRLNIDGLIALTAQLDQARSDIQATVSALPQIAANNEAWSECMSDSGYSVADPGDAQQFAFAEVGEGDHERFVAVAIADFNCQRGVQMRETYYDLIAATEEDWLEEHPDFMTEVASAQQLIADKANQLSTDLGMSE